MPANDILRPEALRQYRLEKKLSQKDLAFIFGVGAETVAEWENGQTQINGTSAIILQAVITASNGGLTTELMFGNSYIIYKLLKEVFEPLKAINNDGAKKQAVQQNVALE